MFALRGRDDVGAFSSTEYRMLENIEFFQRWGNNNRQIIDKIELHIKQQRNLLSKSLQSLSENLNNYSFDIKFKENFLCSKRIEEHRDNLTLTHNIIKKF